MKNSDWFVNPILRLSPILSVILLIAIILGNFSSFSYINFWQIIFSLWLITIIGIILYFTISGIRLIKYGKSIEDKSERQIITGDYD